MKRGMLAAVICVCMLVGACPAQDSSRRALAEELLGLMDVQENMEKSFEILKQMLPSQLPQADVPGGGAAGPAQGEIQKMMDMIMEEMSWDKLKGDYISMYAETFTEEELKGIIAFYKSPVGKKFIEKQPELMQRSMQISQKQMGEIMPKVQELTREMIEKAKAQKAVQPSQ